MADRDRNEGERQNVHEARFEYFLRIDDQMQNENEHDCPREAFVAYLVVSFFSFPIF